MSPYYPALVCLALLSACAGVQDVVIQIPPHVATAGPSALSQIPPREVAVATFRRPVGTGILPGRIGERKTIGDVSMGLVTADPGPERVVTDAIKAELVAAGHRAGAGDAAAIIEGEIGLFDIHTDVTALYWDMVGTVSLRVTAGRRGKRPASGQYDATCTERTYVWPTGDLMARVLGVCVDDISRQFRDDTTVARALSE